MTFLGKPSQVSGSHVWDGSKFLASVITGSGSGSSTSFNSGSFISFGIADYASTSNTASSPQSIGQLIFDPRNFTGPITFRSILASTTGSVTASVQLFNVTSGTFVHIGGAGVTTLSTNSTTPIMLQSVNLLTATNFNPITSSVYEVRIYGSGSSPITTLINSELVCT